MGTRSLTVFKDGEEEICVLYRQFDGHLDSHGMELKELLADMQVVNGISSRDAKLANGMGCLTAQVIAHLKKEVGNFYVHPAGTRDCGEEYIYTLYCPDKPEFRKPAKVHVKIQAGAMTFFGAPGTKQEEMPVLYDGPIADFDPVKIEAEAASK